MKTTRWTTTLLVGLLWFGQAVRVDAQPPTDDQRARNHFLAGTSYYEEARYAQALQEFLEAYRLSGRAELLVNASRAAERNLDFRQAIELVDQFLATAAPDHPQRSSETARRAQLVLLAERAGQGQQTTTTTGTTGPTGTTGTEPSPLEVEDEGGGLGTMGYVGIGLLGGGGALGVVSLATGLVANGRYSDLERVCRDGACEPSKQDDIDSGRRLARLSTATTFLGVGAAVAGVVMLVLDDGPAEDSAAARVRILPGPGQAGIGLGWSF